MVDPHLVASCRGFMGEVNHNTTNKDTCTCISDRSRTPKGMYAMWSRAPQANVSFGWVEHCCATLSNQHWCQNPGACATGRFFCTRLHVVQKSVKLHVLMKTELKTLTNMWSICLGLQSSVFIETREILTTSDFWNHVFSTNTINTVPRFPCRTEAHVRGYPTCPELKIYKN